MELPVQLGGGTASRPVICGPSSTLSIRALSVDMRISLPTLCSIMKSWNTSGDESNAVRKGDASSALTCSQKPESSLRSGCPLCFSKPTRQMLMAWERGKQQVVQRRARSHGDGILYRKNKGRNLAAPTLLVLHFSAMAA